jgi:Arc/MetJ family transcription regulator
MRTNIDIDDRLMEEAMKSSGSRTKRAAVEGLRILIQTRVQASIRRLRGKVKWEGDLERSRLRAKRQLAHHGDHRHHRLD